MPFRSYVLNRSQPLSGLRKQTSRGPERWHLYQQQRECLDSIAKTLQLKTLDDWYSVSKASLENHGASGLLNKFSGSPARMIMSVYKEHTWKPWKFSRVHSHYWSEPSNVRAYFEDLGKQIGLKSTDDWHQVKSRDFIEHDGLGLLDKFGHSIEKALAFAYPEHKWKNYHFHKGKRVWSNLAHAKHFLDEVAHKLNLKSWEDWYQVSKETVEEEGGKSLLQLHDGNLGDLLSKVYPEHDWKLWCFRKVPHGFWSDKGRHKEFFDWAWKELRISTFEDWYRVRFEDIVKLGGKSLLIGCYNGSLIGALSSIYPEYTWEKKRWKFNTSASKAQTSLFDYLVKLFPTCDTYLCFDCNTLSKEVTTEMKKLEVDVAIPSLKLVFEYQGEQHYDIIHPRNSQMYDDPASQQLRDSAKKRDLQKLGLTLVEIPFWWDKSESSLKATILKERPDLKSLVGTTGESAQAIDRHRPDHFHSRKR
eukprot:TRINITY_DN3989_c0_g1_i1.p1 TRINITY_DN3989_c0_g1~~TRINITY_DN3989_c0_g1_i1.p1  ORF type:complete len:475 (-),score=70.21 TRINITY_DN3989_c0_g1_i1:108-1532(-)